MTTPQEMRDLARCLLIYEGRAGKAPGSEESATLRVYDKLRLSLSEFAGTAGFQSLASRALVLAKAEAPVLSAAKVTADGSLQGLAEIGPQIDLDKNQGGESQAGEGGVILIARLLGLLLIFLGAAMTLRLLRDVWPAAAFNECNAGNGRKA